MNANYYHSMRREPVRLTATKRNRNPLRVVGILILILALLGGTGYALIGMHSAKPGMHSTVQQTTKLAALKSSPPSTLAAPVAAPLPTTDQCSSNPVGNQLILVSISQRHMWACDGTTVAYDSAVVTGMENLAADLTPTGTYHIYGKQTNLYLNGSDTTGSWHDYVNYWMPFLHNQYGSYGFHDATWRASTDFGNISPYSSNASHGCVELPLATATWLYGWAPINTAVTIEI